MNKNTIIGIVMIIAILIVWNLIFGPSKEDLAKRKRYYDSVQKVNKENHIKDSILFSQKKASLANPDTIRRMRKDSTALDSLIKINSKDAYGVFGAAVNGKKKIITIENELAKFRFTTEGGKLCYVQLSPKNYHTFDSLPLVLLNNDSTKFNFVFNTNYVYKRTYKVKDLKSKNKTRDSVATDSTNRSINTGMLVFDPVIMDARFRDKDSISLKGSDSLKLSMRLYPDSTFNPQKNKYFELLYTIYGDNYMMRIQANFKNLRDVIQSNSSVNLQWKMRLRQQEKSLKNEKMASTIYFKYFGDEVDYLSETKNGNKDLTTKVNWIGFKQQFFTSTLIADQGFSSAKITTDNNDTALRIVKVCTADISIPLDADSKQGFPMRMYFGPNKYKTMKKYDIDIEHQIPLGWSSPYILGWINRFAVIPVFNLLENTGMNYGIIILILTILLKIVLFPIAYKTYVSSAKMRVLKPEIDEINKKYPKEKALERQQATMSLYKKAGVNPLAGCIPMLLQMPILIALYRFFPASIELRQQHFLWATDLSSYDSVLKLGFNIPMYGDHISLFCLLMTISTIIYTRVNNQLMGTQQQMPGMKVMMYIMPVMFLGFFNNFAAGLSYYYFLANMLTFLQMWLIRRTVNEDAIHQRIQEYRKKPDTKKKSGFQKRLEDMAKQRGYKLPNKR